jgi:thiol-disulfide isomerase/thioredoxin
VSPRTAAVAALLVLAASSGWAAEPTPKLLPVGVAAPPLVLERVAGGTLSLADLRGRVVLVDFWATWCPPCRAELPWLVKLAKRYAGEGLWLVAVNQDHAAEQRALVSSFAPTVPGLQAWTVYGTDAATSAWHVDGLPTLYLVDRAGRIVVGHEGRLTEEAVTRAVESALRGR